MTARLLLQFVDNIGISPLCDRATIERDERLRISSGFSCECLCVLHTFVRSPKLTPTCCIIGLNFEIEITHAPRRFFFSQTVSSFSIFFVSRALCSDGFENAAAQPSLSCFFFLHCLMLRSLRLPFYVRLTFYYLEIHLCARLAHFIVI